MKIKNSHILFFTGLGAVTIVGIFALIERFQEGLAVTNLTNTIPWGLWIALYIYFIGLSAGSFLLSTLVYVFNLKRFEAVGRISIFQAIICLALGMILVLIDLGHPERFFLILTNWNYTSVLAWECYFYIGYSIILLAELYFIMRTDLIALAEKANGFLRVFYKICSLGSKVTTSVSTGRDMMYLKILGIIGIPMAIFVHGGTGAIFAVVKARPSWYTGLFPLIFLISALVSGGALLTFLTAFFSKIRGDAYKNAVNSLAKLTACILCFDLFLLAIETLVTFYGGMPKHIRAYELTFFGPYWWVFWFVQIGLGAIIPLVIIFVNPLKKSIKMLGAAGFLIILGIVAVRLNIVIPPLIDPEFPGLAQAYQHFRFSIGYFPSLNEWLCSGAAIATGIWIFVIGNYFLPLWKKTEDLYYEK